MIENRLSFPQKSSEFFLKYFWSPVLLVLNAVYGDHVTTRNEESEKGYKRDMRNAAVFSPHCQSSQLGQVDRFTDQM